MKKLMTMITVCALLFCGCGQKTTPVQTDLNVAFLGVGKGDCVVLWEKDFAVVIDTGYQDTGEMTLNFLKEKNIDKIDALVITHFDMDHIGGAATLMNNMEIDKICVPDYQVSTPYYQSFEAALKESGNSMTTCKKKTLFTLGDTDFVIYPPKEDDYEQEDNDFSLCVQTTHGQNKMLFPGDAQEDRIDELLTQIEAPVSLMKLPHHGIYEDNTEFLLALTTPKIAVMTCDENEQPSKMLLATLQEYSVNLFLCQNKTLQFVCDGETITKL